MIIFLYKNGRKVIKGQHSDGTISKITCYEEYYLCGKFHGFTKKCTILPILGATPLYYICSDYLEELYFRRLSLTYQ